MAGKIDGVNRSRRKVSGLPGVAECASASTVVSTLTSLPLVACDHPGLDPAVPAYAPGDQAAASAAKSASRPLVLEWPAADRAALEAQRAGGVVVVRYGGSEMEVLRGCRAPGAYRYVPVTPKKEGLVVRDASELAAAMPIHTVSLEARLSHQQELDVAMTIVGLAVADRSAWGSNGGGVFDPDPIVQAWHRAHDTGAPPPVTR